MIRTAIALLFVPFLAGLGLSQQKKPDPKNQARILVASPLGAATGSTTRLTLRGLKLDESTDVQITEMKGTVKLLKKSKVPVPMMQVPEKVGDSQVEIELTVPVDLLDATIFYLKGTLYRWRGQCLPPYAHPSPDTRLQTACRIYNLALYC